MKLTEAEGKQFLQEYGIKTPSFFLVKKEQEIPDAVSYPAIMKAQTLVGGRGKAGLVKEAADKNELLFGLKTIWQGNYEKRPFSEILIESKLDSVREYYVSCAYDQSTRGPVIVLSKFGGMDIELVVKRQAEAVIKQPVDVLKGINTLDFETLFKKADIKEELHEQMQKLITKLYDCFVSTDAELVEINPLIETKDGNLISVDCKMSLDQTALYRHDFSFPQRTGARELTEMEKQAREIDARSHRGVVGRSMLELDGDIAFMSSGGGASITCLDALMSYGGRPANFVEYSGNPEREDVKDLTKLVLSKKGLRALWVVGPTANFTDIYETLGGVLDALQVVKPSFPILIRRAGPRDDEAKVAIEKIQKETDLDIIFYGEEISMTESAKILMDKIGVETNNI